MALPTLWSLLASLWPLIRTTALALLLAATILGVRLFTVLPSSSRQPRRRRSPDDKCPTALFLGSGGHTTELLLLLRSLDPQRYVSRSYYISSGDDFSRAKAITFEQEWAGEKASAYTIVALPRARAVHQSWLSTPLSTILCFVACARRLVLPHLSRSRDPSIPAPPELILMNGPGTCVPLVAAVYVNRVSCHESEPCEMND